MSTDPVQAVLRDFENIIWLTTLIGLGVAGVWHYLVRSSRRSSAIESVEGGGVITGDVPESLPISSEVPGVPVRQFTRFDLVFLPLVLMKYSFSLQLIVASLFTPTEKTKAVAEGGSEVVEALAEPKTISMSPELILVDMSINLFLIALIILMIQWVGQRRTIDSVLGLSRLSLNQVLLWIAAGSLICTPLIILTSNGMPDLMKGIFGEEIKEQAAVQTMRDSPHLGMTILLILNACIVAPIVEELVFRGYFYGVMKRFTGTMFAAFVTGAIFAVAHQSLLALLPLWAFALLLTLFYEGSRSLWVPIGIHAAFNAVNVTFILMGVGGEMAPAGEG